MGYTHPPLGSTAKVLLGQAKAILTPAQPFFQPGGCPLVHIGREHPRFEALCTPQSHSPAATSSSTPRLSTMEGFIMQAGAETRGKSENANI